jgi:hypothetical protein
MLRYVFNQQQYEIRAQTGLIRRRVTRSSPAPGASGQPPGTMSRFYEYSDHQGRILAKAFHYDRPTGYPWRPDPKWIRTEAEILTPSHDDLVECEDCATYRSLAQTL